MDEKDKRVNKEKSSKELYDIAKALIVYIRETEEKAKSHRV